jgi:hypothetical protein
MQKRPPTDRGKGFALARTVFACLLAIAFVAGIAAGSASPARALSEIKRETMPGAADPSTPDSQTDTPIDKETLPPIGTVPIPDVNAPTSPAADEPTDPSAPDEAEPGEGGPDDEGGSDDAARPQVDPNAPIPEIIYDIAKLPEPVRRKREMIIEATKTGDLEKLRPLFDTGEDATQLSLGGIDGDPIAFLRDLSGDKEGQEILAILEEVMSAGFVHMDAGTPNDMYVWPYFFAVPLDRLTPPQRVELFKIVTAGDYEDMKTYGTYIFYRVGITPDGRWSFFVAGD